MAYLIERSAGMLMAALAIKGVDLFTIAGRSISRWIPSLKTATTIRQPFCSQLEERLLLWLEYHPLKRAATLDAKKLAWSATVHAEGDPPRRGGKPWWEHST